MNTQQNNNQNMTPDELNAYIDKVDAELNQLESDIDMASSEDEAGDESDEDDPQFQKLLDEGDQIYDELVADLDTELDSVIKENI